MYILLWLLFGAIVGYVASLIVKKNHRMGLISNILAGIIGSALGMWLLDLLELGKPDTFSIEGFLVSIGGAVILLLVISAIRRRL